MKRIASLALLILLLPLPGIGEAAGQPSGWDYVWAWQNDVAYVEKDGKIGLIHKDGRTMIEPRFDYVMPFENGIAAVYEGYIGQVYQEELGKYTSFIAFDYLREPMPGKWGLIDQEGHVFVEPQWADEPLHGKFSENNWSGYMDDRGRVLLDPVWKTVPYQIESMEDLQPVQRNGKLHFVDANGNVKLTTENFDYMSQTWDAHDVFMEVEISVGKAKAKRGAVDRKGNFVVPPEYDDVGQVNIGTVAEIFYSGGRYSGIGSDSRALVRKGEKWGLWDTVNRQLLVKPEWDEYASFSPDFFFVRKGGKWGLVDMDGETVHKPQWLDVSITFPGEGLATVLVRNTKAGGEYAAINRKGEVLAEGFKRIDRLDFHNGLASVRDFGIDSNKNGYINEEGVLVIELPDDYWQNEFTGKLAPVRTDEKTGLLNTDGKWVVEPRWWDVSSFSGGYATVQDESLGKLGLVSEEGQFISALEWDCIGYMREGYAFIYDGQYNQGQNYNVISPREAGVLHGKYGYMNEEGKAVIPLQWDSAGDFIGGKAAVFSGLHSGNLYGEYGNSNDPIIGQQGYINQQGQPISGVKPQTDSQRLHEALVQADALQGQPEKSFISGSVDGVSWKYSAWPLRKWGLVSTDGTDIIKAEWDAIPALFQKQVYADGVLTKNNQPMSDRFAVVVKDRFSFDATGVISLSGKMILEPVWRAVHFDPLTNRILVVDSEYRIGIYGLDGQRIAEPQWEWIEEFSEGLAAVRVGKKYGFIDESYKTAIKPSWDSVRGFSEGYAVVRQNNKYGLIDARGKSVSKPQWEYLDDVSCGRSLVRQKDQYGYLGTDGKIAIAAQWDFATRFNDGKARVKKDTAWGFIDVNGALIGELAWERAFDFSQGRAAVKKDGKWGFINESGDIAIKLEWDYVWPFNHGEARVELGGRYGYIDLEGALISGLK